MSAGNRANSAAQVTPSRASTIRPVIQQRLSGSTTIRAGLGPKNLIGGGLFDPGPGDLVEDTDQGPGVPTLGRGTREAGQRAGALLGVLDEAARPKLKQGTADEIFSGANRS